MCSAVELGDGQAQGCFDAQSISTGLAYGLHGEPDGGYIAVGVVPDAVNTVEVGGVSIPIVGNV